MKYPDYNNCLANLPNSILKWFGIDDNKNRITLKMMDEELKCNYKNVVVIILDGMGVQVIKDNLKEYGFFASHMKGTYCTVFPSTTVAATTSALSGMPPCQHGWLGWDVYFQQINKNVEVFSNNESGTDTKAAEFNVPWKFIPYKPVVDIINENGGQAYHVVPFLEPYPSSFTDVCDIISDLCKKSGEKYIYSYWSEPDSTMHRTGCKSQDAKKILTELEHCVEELSKRVEDTLIIVTADHGQLDSKGITILDYPQIMECLERTPSIEPRAINFFVRNGMKEDFEKRFSASFGQNFKLFTKEEVKDMKLFGDGEEHKCFDSMLGDFIAVTDGDLTIYNSYKDRDKFIGVHAGLTDEEMIIPFIVIK